MAKLRQQKDAHKGPYHVKQPAKKKIGAAGRPSVPLKRRSTAKKRKELFIPKNHGQGVKGDNATGSKFGTSHPVQK
tara:strand:- start:702 stop:929 length:228 start_codon:yes stop_codon:yes gene_type:complete